MMMKLTILLFVVILRAEAIASVNYGHSGFQIQIENLWGRQPNPKKPDVTSVAQISSDERLDKLEQDIKTLTADITRLRACTAPRVAFIATFKNPGSISVVYFATLKYNKIIENAGDNYDVNTGIFTCAEPGVYSFTVHAITEIGKPTCLWLRHNDYQVTQLHAGGDKDYYDSASMGATITLGLGDEVEVVWSCIGSTLYQGHQANIFMGHLVHGDACL